MNVLIDATCVTKNKAGVGIYVANLIKELASISGGHRLFVLAQDDDPSMDYSRWPDVHMIWVPARIFRILPFRFLLEQIVLPILLIRHSIQVVHSVHYSLPLVCFGARRIVTIHDMTSYDMPEVHKQVKALYYRLSIFAAAHLADGLIFVSHSAERDFRSRFGRYKRKSWVIHHGKSEAFHPDIQPDQVERVRRKYELGTDFALYIGTLEPRKNVARLVGAFMSVAANHPKLMLVIVGKKGWMYDGIYDAVAKSGLESRVKFTGFIPEEEKPYFLAGAKVFIYPSLYEGFGIPVLEALACGIPTITSNTSSLPEVAGHAALLVDPTSEEQISSAMQILLLDSSLQERLREESVLQAAKFTWRKTADLTLAAYVEVIQDTFIS
jgi:glycosyltransferase involved in cell wall biosynthesis